MNENNEQKRVYDNVCSNNVHQIIRFRHTERSLEDLDAKKSRWTKLPSNCLQRILSFMTYEKVSQLGQVCTAFNDMGKTLLDNSHIELEKRLKREIGWAVNMAFFPTNLKSSYDRLCFLNGLYEAINNLTNAYAFCVDYFVAGKLLDEANCLLKDFNSLTMVPYVIEHDCDKWQHPFLDSIVIDSEKAHQHFKMKIFPKLINYDEVENTEHFQYFLQNELELELQFERTKARLPKINLLKSRKQKVNCGNEVKREFFKLILKLNENVLDLAQRAEKEEEEVGKIINKMDKSIIVPTNKGRSNCLVNLSASSSSLLHRETTKVMGAAPRSKQLNLATLPSSCIQNIISYLNCDKMAQLRLICKSFNEAGKKEINQEFEKLKQNLEFKIEYIEKKYLPFSYKMHTLEKNMMKDACSLLQLCKDYYKWHLGNNYYFVAGKILDEANCLYNELKQHFDAIPLLGYLDRDYKYRPYFSLFYLMNLVYKAIAHFKFNVVPKYLPSTQKRTYVPDFIITGEVMDFEKEIRLNLEEIEKLLEIEDAKIKKQNDKNKKFIKIISSLKKKVVFLNKNEIFKTLNVLKELE